MFRKLVCALLVAGVFALPQMTHGDCEFDCFEIDIMGGISNGDDYCFQFVQPTGRLVWSSGGDAVGGTPFQVDCNDPEDPFQQDVKTSDFCDQLQCPFSQRPQELNAFGVQSGIIGFGCYVCSP